MSTTRIVYFYHSFGNLFFISSIDGFPDDICAVVNDEKKSYNCIMKPLAGNKIGLFVVKEKSIKIGEELTYSYSDGYHNMPWRKVLAFLYLLF